MFQQRFSWCLLTVEGSYSIQPAFDVLFCSSGSFVTIQIMLRLELEDEHCDEFQLFFVLALNFGDCFRTDEPVLD